jgi:hypothetical protein
MTLELIVFVASILFGILLYWRESNGNGLYRIINRLVYSKELQMKPEDRTGFVFRQKFLLRLVYITFMFLIIIVIFQFLIPINYTTISIFASSIVGTLAGTYLANFVLKSGKVIDEKSDSLGEIMSDTIEKGKEFIEDITGKEEEAPEVPEDQPGIEEDKQEKSARERLKDKGLL